MKASEDIPKREYDPKAETIAELVEASGLGRQAISFLAKKKVASGQWKLVYKKVGGRGVPAYRKVK